jgi:hypothetical protein
LNNAWTQLKVVIVAAVVLLSAGCGGGGGDSPPAAAAETPTPPSTGANTNTAPTIQGQPGTTVLAGQSYSFQPVAADADGDTLTFTAANVPTWASFNASTGRLTGTPAAADVGTYSGVKITVSDGKASASSAAFAITVTAVATGSATVSWTPPTANTDGSVLSDLASYRIIYGRSATDLSQSVTIDSPGMSRYVVENLSTGAWYFAVVAVNASGGSSEPSNIGSKTIS